MLYNGETEEDMQRDRIIPSDARTAPHTRHTDLVGLNDVPSKSHAIHLKPQTSTESQASPLFVDTQI